MIKKIFYYFFSVIQVIFGIALFVDLEEHASDFMLGMHDAFSTYPKDVAAEMIQMFDIGFCKSFIMFSAAMIIFSAILFLVLVIFNRVSKKKGLAITAVVGTILFGMSDVAFVLSILALALVIREKKDNDNKDKEKAAKEKKTIQKLRTLKVSGKDIGLSIIFILVYCSQFVLDKINIADSLMLIVIIAYYLLVFGLSFVVFNKRFKRDFGALKDNFGTYIKYIFKMWGIMLLFSMLAVSVQMLLGVEGDSANQTALQSAPLWYVVPLAVIWAPLVEECLFRGVIRRFIPNNDILFIVVSAMSFGLLHTIGQEATVYMTIVHSLQYAAMGGVMAYVYTRTNNIFTNIGVHFVQNSFSSIVMILMNLV